MPELSVPVPEPVLDTENSVNKIVTEPGNISQATMRPPLEYREVATALSAPFVIYLTGGGGEETDPHLP